jgi:hypothetical protein
MQIANLKDELLRKTAEVEKAQQLRAEAVSRATALAAAAASAALPGRPAPDRRLSESGVAKRTLTLTEEEPEKSVRTKRLSDAMVATAEETEAPGEVSSKATALGHHKEMAALTQRAEWFGKDAMIGA